MPIYSNFNYACCHVSLYVEHYLPTTNKLVDYIPKLTHLPSIGTYIMYVYEYIRTCIYMHRLCMFVCKCVWIYTYMRV